VTIDFYDKTLIKVLFVHINVGWVVTAQDYYYGQVGYAPGFPTRQHGFTPTWGNLHLKWPLRVPYMIMNCKAYYKNWKKVLFFWEVACQLLRYSNSNGAKLLFFYQNLNCDCDFFDQLSSLYNLSPQFLFPIFINFFVNQRTFNFFQKLFCNVSIFTTWWFDWSFCTKNKFYRLLMHLILNVLFDI